MKFELNDNFWIIFNLFLFIVAIRKKHLFLLYAIYIFCNGFSFFDREFLYVQGFFRFRDIIFIALMIITALSAKPERMKILKASLLKKGILLIVIFNIALAIYTYYRWDYTVGELIAVARDYPLYMVAFSTVILIKDEKSFFSILFIVQTIVGNTIEIFPFPYRFIRERVVETYSEKVFRLRAWGKFVPAYFIALFFSLYVFTRNKKYIFFWASCFLATILTFDRTISFASIVALPFSVYIVSFFKKRRIKTKMNLRKLVLPALGIFLSLISLNFFSETLVRDIIARFSSTASNIIERSGTYADRIEKLNYALSDILPDNLMLGVGFYHNNHYADYIRENVYPDGHIGIFYILITAGIFFWMLYFGFVIYILLRYLKRFNTLRDPLYKSILFMTIASIITKLIAWHYQEFSDPIGITITAFSIGLSELAIYYDKKKWAKEVENLPSVV